MLVGKDHAGGEGSCWWERIMLVLQDDEECRNVVFATEKSFFSQKNGYKKSRNTRNPATQQTTNHLAPCEGGNGSGEEVQRGPDKRSGFAKGFQIGPTGKTGG